MTNIPRFFFPLLLLGSLAACSAPADARLLRTAGVHATVTCVDAKGVERTSFCGATISAAEADSVTKRLGLKPLAHPEKHGLVTNVLNLPFECRLLLFDNPRPMTLSGIFDSPRVLFEQPSAVQFASVVLARSDSTGQSCFTFILEYG